METPYKPQQMTTTPPKYETIEPRDIAPFNMCPHVINTWFYFGHLRESPLLLQVWRKVVDSHVVDSHVVDSHVVDIHVVDSHVVDSHVVDSHVVDSHVVDSHVVDSHVVDSHVVDSHVVDRHLVDSHVVDSHVVDSHVVDSHVVDSRVVDSHAVDSHVVDSRVVDSHVVDSHVVDSLIFCYLRYFVSRAILLCMSHLHFNSQRFGLSRTDFFMIQWIYFEPEQGLDILRMSKKLFLWPV